MSEIKKGVVLNYLNMAIGALIPLLYTPIMLRLLGQNEYGLYKLSSSVTGYLGLLSMGIGSAILRNLIKARTEGGHKEEQRVFSLFLVIYKCIAALILLVGAILVFNLDIWYADSLDNEGLHKMQILVTIMTCQSAMSFILGPYYSIITAHEKYIFAQSAGIFLTILGPVSNLTALFLGYASIGMAVSSFIVSIIGQFTYIWYVSKRLDIHAQYKNLPWHLVNDIFIFSFWIFLGQITSLLNNSTDNLLIGARPELGTLAVSVYSIGATVTSMIFSLTTGVSSVLAPRVNKLCFEGASNEQLTDFAIQVGRIQMYIVTLIVTGFAALGVPFLSFYAGAGYADSYWVTLCVAIPMSIPFCQNVFLNVIMARFQHKFRAIVYLAIAFANVTCTYFILPYFGVIGAAFMTGLADFIGHGIIMNIYYNKIGMNIPRFWKSIWKIWIFPILLLVLFLSVQKHITFNLFLFTLVSISYFMVCTILQYYFIMNNYEKRIILSISHKIYHR